MHGPATVVENCGPAKIVCLNTVGHVNGHGETGERLRQKVMTARFHGCRGLQRQTGHRCHVGRYTAIPIRFYRLAGHGYFDGLVSASTADIQGPWGCLGL